ncbi:unnamed protein product [Symbiodinium sp. CCMP2592]|nr:unnamed protein product [Symbiodinium sp. CCMP2592]
MLTSQPDQPKTLTNHVVMVEVSRELWILSAERGVDGLKHLSLSEAANLGAALAEVYKTMQDGTTSGEAFMRYFVALSQRLEREFAEGATSRCPSPEAVAKLVTAFGDVRCHEAAGISQRISRKCLLPALLRSSTVPVRSVAQALSNLQVCDEDLMQDAKFDVHFGSFCRCVLLLYFTSDVESANVIASLVTVRNLHCRSSSEVCSAKLLSGRTVSCKKQRAERCSRRRPFLPPVCGPVAQQPLALRWRPSMQEPKGSWPAVCDQCRFCRTSGRQVMPRGLCKCWRHVGMTP